MFHTETEQWLFHEEGLGPFYLYAGQDRPHRPVFSEEALHFL